MHFLDPLTRRWWAACGSPVDLDDPAHAFLRAPYNEKHAVGDSWLDQFEADGKVIARSADHGLIEGMSQLDGPGFCAADLHPMVRDFYQHTSRWRMEVWSQWNPLLAPGGVAVSALFGRRVRQLALPTAPLSVSRGMSSDVRVVVDENGDRLGAAWLRTLRLDGSAVYSGFYRVGHLPSTDQPHVAVAFPLELGNVQVYLAPTAEPDGSLLLDSRSRVFGEDGAYVSVLVRGRWHAARVPLRERFRVYVDDEGVLRTDHALHLGPVRALRLHYRLDRTTASSSS